MSNIEHPRDFADIQLTDATDDFDYLTASDQRYFSYPDTPHSPLFANQLDVWTPTYLETIMRRGTGS